MKIIILTISILAILLSHGAKGEEVCKSQSEVEKYLEYNLWFLEFTKYNNQCSQISEGDFDGDGETDFAAVLTEVQPFDKYANGQDWYRTYVVVLLNSELPYNKYQAVFVRTDGNKPKGVTVKSLATEKGHDLVIELDRYSYTRYKWSNHGFNAIYHTAD